MGGRSLSRIEQLGLDQAVNCWWQGQVQILEGATPSVQLLHDFAEHGYDGSYKSKGKYVRVRFGMPAVRLFRRVETPPGAQTQSDWGEFHRVDLGDLDGRRRYALRHGPQPQPQRGRRLEPVDGPARLASRPQRGLPSARRRGRGQPHRQPQDRHRARLYAWGQINEQYRVYTTRWGSTSMLQVARRTEGEDGARVGDCKGLDVQDRRFDGLTGLQSVDRRGPGGPRGSGSARRPACPWRTPGEAEKPFLRPLPALLPEPFDLVRTPVHKDCTVHFEGRSYVVPFIYSGRDVEVRGCSGCVQIIDPLTATVLVSYPRHSRERILIDQARYEGPGTAEMPRPSRWDGCPQAPGDRFAAGGAAASGPLALAEVAR